MAKCIYVADDEEHIRMLIKTFLENEGYEVSAFLDGAGLLEACGRQMPDLIILDIMMPGLDGLSICSAIRRDSTVPIIIVSAKDSPLDRVTGITLGSDDYLVKPFLPLELVARVKALLRRSEITRGQKEETDAFPLCCGNLSLDRKARVVMACGVQMAVTPTEFNFLQYLMERLNTAVSKKELLRVVWNCQEESIDTRMPDDLVKRLRKKLRDADAGVAVETVWGYGFRLSRIGEDAK